MGRRAVDDTRLVAQRPQVVDALAGHAADFVHHGAMVGGQQLLLEALHLFARGVALALALALIDLQALLQPQGIVAQIDGRIAPPLQFADEHAARQSAALGDDDPIQEPRLLLGQGGWRHAARLQLVQRLGQTHHLTQLGRQQAVGAGARSAGGALGRGAHQADEPLHVFDQPPQGAIAHHQQPLRQQPGQPHPLEGVGGRGAVGRRRLLGDGEVEVPFVNLAAQAGRQVGAGGDGHRRRGLDVQRAQRRFTGLVGHVLVIAQRHLLHHRPRLGGGAAAGRPLALANDGPQANDPVARLVLVGRPPLEADGQRLVLAAVVADVAPLPQLDEAAVEQQRVLGPRRAQRLGDHQHGLDEGALAGTVDAGEDCQRSQLQRGLFADGFEVADRPTRDHRLSPPDGGHNPATE